MKYSLNLPNRPFDAIKKGTKKVEGRVPGEIPNKYQKMKQGDVIIITNEDTGEKMKISVTFVHHYLNTRAMLETEGIKNVSSSGGTVEQVIENFNSFTGYKENLPKYGIYAIGVELIV